MQPFKKTTYYAGGQGGGGGGGPGEGERGGEDHQLTSVPTLLPQS